MALNLKHSVAGRNYDGSVAGWRNRDNEPAAGDHLLEIYLEEIDRIPLLTKEQEQQLTQTIFDCRTRLEDNQKEPLLTEDERHGLNAQLRTASRKMAEANQRLVVKFARPFAAWTQHLSLLDLIQAGNKGLIRAIEGFDYRKGFKFSTYAVTRIRQAIFREIDKTDRVIHLPVHLGSRLRSLNKTRERLAETFGRAIPDEELAALLDKDVGKIKEAAVFDKLGRKLQALDQPVSERSEASLLDLLADDQAADPETAAIETADLERQLADLADRLRWLDEPEQAVLLLRFCNGDTLTPYSSIGRQLGMAENSARNIAKAGLSKLLRLMHGQPAEGGRQPDPDNAPNRPAKPAEISFDYAGEPAMAEIKLGQTIVRLAEESQPPDGTDWLQAGACLLYDLDVFYPDRVSSSFINAVKAVCLKCSVKTPCLERALDQGYPGIWGATSRRERQVIIRQRLQIKAAKTGR